KHPASWAERLNHGQSLAHGWERLDAETRRIERVLLELRLVDGLDLAVLDEAGRRAARDAADDELLAQRPIAAGRAVLTRRGRLLADAVCRRLLGWDAD